MGKLSDKKRSDWKYFINNKGLAQCINDGTFMGHSKKLDKLMNTACNAINETEDELVRLGVK